MFDIEYKGGNSVKISTKKVDFVFDPKLSMLGLKDVSIKESVELVTEERFSVQDDASKLLINGPGEYEVAEVSISGTRALRHLDSPESEPLSTIYRLEIADVRIAVLGNIAPKLNDEQLESIGVVDILVIPVGGNGYTLDSVSASTIARQIDPKVVIPVHFADSGIKYEVPQDEVDMFVKEIATPVEDAGLKYKIKSSSSIPQTLTVVRIDRS